MPAYEIDLIIIWCIIWDTYILQTDDLSKNCVEFTNYELWIMNWELGLRGRLLVVLNNEIVIIIFLLLANGIHVIY